MTFDPRLADEQRRTRQYGTSIKVEGPVAGTQVFLIDIMNVTEQGAPLLLKVHLTAAGLRDLQEQIATALHELARGTSKPPPR